MLAYLETCLDFGSLVGGECANREEDNKEQEGSDESENVKGNDKERGHSNCNQGNRAG